tara:strand:+ start:12759 stop:13736 length:978 start_codon:yes stop_codon:yes gene_type:complete
MTSHGSVSIPWVEKYRPTDFNQIVLNSLNKKICENIIKESYFPNLLFYGPPGTGKTTTIINLVSSYQKKVNVEDKTLMIHLNASDDRGIDIIRNQILQFVNSKCLFSGGLKFVILDEVDYMTKNAQQALRYLINMFSSDVRFCLICNYISRIDDGLQTEFLKIRFNNLPQRDVTAFLKNIVEKEQINISDDKINSIYKVYGSDIRSMINFIQCNHILGKDDIKIIHVGIWERMTEEIKALSKKQTKTKSKYASVLKYLNKISNEYNITVKNIIKDYFTYLIKDQHVKLNSELLFFIEKLIHTTDCSNCSFINYALVNMEKHTEFI